MKNQSQIARYYEKLNAYLQEGRNLNEAQSILKQEGMSQEQFDYQTGLAIDFRDIQMPSNNEAMWQWLALNGAQYGFIVRYPSDKEAITNVKSNPWHFRYVGITVATEMQEHNECLEEYLERRNQDGNLKSSGSM